MPSIAKRLEEYGKSIGKRRNYQSKTRMVTRYWFRRVHQWHFSNNVTEFRKLITCWIFRKVATILKNH